MSPPPRRSSRLRGSYSSPTKPDAASSGRLSRLAERDETANSGTQSDQHVTTSSEAPRTPATVGRIRPPFEEMHPGKAHSTSSPSFDFRNARPTPALGPDAQRMMDEIRDEALRIKVQLAAQLEEKKRREIYDSSNTGTGRKIATPKSKIGRFSDVHLAEFKKMDSIAGHASAFRTQPNRLAAVTKSLKRSQSSAKLDGKEAVSRDGNTSNLPQSQENTPAKRIRIAGNQNSSQPSSGNPVAPKLSRSKSILSSILTPTQASLARAASAKKQNQFPKPYQSPSKHSMTAPQRLNKSVTSNNIRDTSESHLGRDMATTVSKFDRFKSIMRRPVIGKPRPTSSNQGSDFMMHYPSKLNLDKELPSTPKAPTMNLSDCTTNVNVTPRSVLRNAATLENTPSAMKPGLPRAKSGITVGDVQYPSLESNLINNPLSKKVDYPVLEYPSLRPELSIPVKCNVPTPSVPGNFTFRSDQTINFGAPRGFGASPGQSSIRQVRPSFVQGTTPVLGAFPDCNKENFGGFDAIPHGLSNKKRHRADSDDEQQEKVAAGSPSKRRKVPASDFRNTAETRQQFGRTTQKPNISSPAKRGVLSLTRLNMLARPKSRK